MSKVWFITGSSRGLGRAAVIAALENGDKVIATARKPETLADIKSKYGDSIITPALDVTNLPQTIQAVEEGIKAFGQIDNVLANAGYGNLASIEDVTMEDFRTQYDTLVFGVVHTVKAVLPILRQQKSGHIMIISSVGGRVGTPSMAAYQSAKWAVTGFGEVLNAEVSPLGIKVTLVEPSGIRTDWAGSSMQVTMPTHEEYKAHVGGVIDMARAGSGKQTGDPCKIAKAIVKISEGEEAPLHLLFGKDAVQYVGMVEKSRLEEIEKWAHISNSTDFEDSEQ